MDGLGENAEHVWALFAPGDVSAVVSGSGYYEPVAYPGDPWT